jgi:hypothetical protein
MDSKPVIIVPLAPAVTGYGTDPNLLMPARTWPLIFSAQQRDLSAAMADIILPPLEGFPLPSDIGIADFLDEWVSAPYPQQTSDRNEIFTLLERIDQSSVSRFGTRFIEISFDQKVLIINSISQGNFESLENEESRQYFLRFRYLVVGGYFTSDIGSRALGYMGNTPLSSYPNVSKEIKNLIENELNKLGL